MVHLTCHKIAQSYNREGMGGAQIDEQKKVQCYSTKCFLKGNVCTWQDLLIIAYHSYINRNKNEKGILHCKYLHARYIKVQ